MEKYSKQNLEQLGIYELRAKARAVGVKSPTTKRHSELVECILKIQKGEQQAFSTKKGRPPKIINFANSSFDLEQAEGVVPNYTYAKDSLNSNTLCDDQYVESVLKTTYPCVGLVRELNGRQYVFDYHNPVHFVLIEEQRVADTKLVVGDFVRGRAFSVNPVTSILDSVIDVNLGSVESCSDDCVATISVQTIDDVAHAHEQIVNQKNDCLKIALELEVGDASIIEMRDKCIYLHSSEYDDVKRSYNAIMDCMNIVKNLSAKKKPFLINLIDIDYIFSLLNAYMISDGKRQDVDAGQFLRDMFLCVKNSNCGSLVIFDKIGYKRNSYLDAIINKYL